MTSIKNRYDFVLIFDVADGNPNGDPDAGNMPRIDPETSQGLVTDVCLKRKVRNYVQMTRGNEKGYDIFIREKAVLNSLIEKAYAELGIDLTEKPENSKEGAKKNKLRKGRGPEVDQVRQKMCADYFDIRTFGAVMSTGANAGQVRGPVQLTFARSVDPVVLAEHSITRMAVASMDESEKQGGDNRTMGRKNTIPYGLYVAHGFISPALANQTGFSEEDLSVLWDALGNMFEFDRSAARGMMSCQKLIAFKHDSAFGNDHANKLFSRIKISKKEGIVIPRRFDDYEVSIDKTELKGVEVLELV